MEFNQNAHLAYCTNVHRGNSWDETFHSLENYVMEVRKDVAPKKRFAIGLRLSADAAVYLSERQELAKFKIGLEKMTPMSLPSTDFPYGNFHGSRVKEQVYRPDWSTQQRLDYTLVLFSILEELLEPRGR